MLTLFDVYSKAMSLVAGSASLARSIHEMRSAVEKFSAMRAPFVSAVFFMERKEIALRPMTALI